MRLEMEYDNEFHFAREQTDESTGPQYLRARYYDMEAGRFTSREPMATGASWLGQPYSYGAGSPILLVDPAGLWPGESKVKKVGGAVHKGISRYAASDLCTGASTVTVGAVHTHRDPAELGRGLVVGEKRGK